MYWEPYRRHRLPRYTSNERIGIGCTTYRNLYRTYRDFFGTWRDRFWTCLLGLGKEDKITPVTVAEEFKQLLPDSHLFYIDECGHAPMMEKPTEFNTILSSFLKGNWTINCLYSDAADLQSGLYIAICRIIVTDISLLKNKHELQIRTIHQKENAPYTM